MNLRLAIVFTCVISASTVCASEPSSASQPLDATKLKLASANAIVVDAKDGQPIYVKGADVVTPIASVTKLMTAMVVLDAGQPLDERLSVGGGDLDVL